MPVPDLSGQVALNSATEGAAIAAGTTVATFTDSNTSDTASGFTATINWGDGTTSAGTVSGSSGAFTVTGGHTYADEGNFTAIATLTRTSDNAQAAPTGPVAVAEGDFGSLFPTTIHANPNQVFSGAVGSFTDDGNPLQTASDWTATIDWGDGTTTSGTVSGAVGGPFTISGTHTYAASGQNTITATFSDDAPSTLTGVTITSTAIVGFPGQPVPIAAAEGTPIPVGTTVATFTDSNTSDAAGDFTATINWGDGTTTAGTVSGSSGSFTVAGGHTYADEGNFQAIATLTRTSDNVQGTSTGAIAVAEGDFGSLFPTTIHVNSNQVFSGAVGSFTDDGNPLQTASDWTATIDWGDGTTTSGAVSGAVGGPFTISGTHTYTAPGVDAIIARFSDDAPSTLTNIAINSTAIVAEQPTVPSNFSGSGMSGVLWRQNTTEAFVQWSMNGSTITSSHSNTYLGTPVLPDSSWGVVGTGDFNGDGKTDILWQRIDGSLADWTMNGSVISASSFVTNQGQVVAPGASWSIAGIGDFNGDNRADILWRNTNGSLAEWLMNGSTITSSGTPTFQGNAISPDSSWSVAATGDFNGDGRADVLWRQGSTGALADWTMNGLTITSSQAPTFQGNAVSPDSSWSIIAVGDFNHDGMSDLLWRQSGSGSLVEWQMQGSQITSSQNITSQGNAVRPDASWNVVEIGDFNGDGKSDVLWRQSTTGALAEWMMNGSQIVSSNAVTFQASQPMPDASWQVQSKPTNFA